MLKNTIRSVIAPSALEKMIWFRVTGRRYRRGARFPNLADPS